MLPRKLSRDTVPARRFWFSPQISRNHNANRLNVGSIPLLICQHSSFVAHNVSILKSHFSVLNLRKLEMWANAQRDGRPVEYRWRPLFNAAKCGWRPLLEYRAVTLPGRETRWNLLGCRKLANSSQPLLGRSSPYYEDMWRRYVDTCLSCEDTAQQICAMVPRWQFLRPVFSASRVQHISAMRSKFALKPHHVWKYGRHSTVDRWD